MTVRIKNSSRLIHAELFVTSGVEYWDLPQYPEIDIRNDDMTHEVEENDRIDKLANKYYGDPNLWWVIALANDLRIVPPDLQAESKIRIPSPVYVTGVLLRAREK